MMNKYNWFITGDTHGDFSRFKTYNKIFNNTKENNIIILGDAGFNYLLDERDSHVKNKISKLYKFRIYCVRGNHEARPQNVKDMILIYDDRVDGYVWMQEKWPSIRYFQDYGIYTINGYKVAVIGGAYSVDKYWRLDGRPEDTDVWTGWFKDEQLTKSEMELAEKMICTNPVDIILSHTCPYAWEPIDLFLSRVDQSMVDKTMEHWMDKIAREASFSLWCWGHYHADRAEVPYGQMFFHNTMNLETLFKIWQDYDKGIELPTYIDYSPTMMKLEMEARND